MNNLFDQVIIPIRQRPLSDDHNRAQSQLYRTMRGLQRLLFSRRANGSTPFTNDGGIAQSGFVWDGFKVDPASPAAMSVRLRAGVGYYDDGASAPTDIDGALATDDRESFKPLVLSATQALTVPAADPTNPRIDIVEVAYDLRAEQPTSVDIKAAVPPFNFVPTVKNKILAWLQDGRVSVNGVGGGLARINYKTGTPAGSPTAPTVTAGYVKIAEVVVDAAVTTIAQNKIRDLRLLLAPGGQLRAAFRATIRGTTAGVGAPTILAASLPPGCSLAIWQTVLGGVFNVALVAGGSPKMPIATLCTEGIAANTRPVGNAFAPSVQTMTSSYLWQIAANGVVVGPAIAEGQPIVYLSGVIYQSFGTASAEDVVLAGTIDFQSY